MLNSNCLKLKSYSSCKVFLFSLLFKFFNKKAKWNKNKVSLSSTSSLSGDLLASIIVIEEGAKFNGLCKMNSGSEETKPQNSKVANLNEGTKV